MVPNETHSDKIPDREFKETIITMLEKFKEDMRNIQDELKMHKSKLLNESKT